jgi:hypothetical protein
MLLSILLKRMIRIGTLEVIDAGGRWSCRHRRATP